MKEELVALLAAMIHEKKSCCPPPCLDPIAGMQYGHTAARHNDSSAQNVNAAQQAFIQQQGAQFAQLLSLTTDLTNGRPPYKKD